MPNNIEIIVALAVPIVVLTILRINAAMVFLSLCLGYVLVQFVANDTDSLISFIAPNHNSISASTWRLIMFLVPVIMTSIIMLFSVKGQIRVALNVLLAAGVSVLGLLLAVPMLTPGLQGSIQSQTLWWDIAKGRAAIVGASAFISLLFLWLQRPHHKKDEDKHHR